jgi:hypothetical protein
MITKNNHIKDLLSTCSPHDWKDWIFHIENNLVAVGYVEALTESGRQDHAARMQSLYDFFGAIDRKEKQS